MKTTALIFGMALLLVAVQAAPHLMGKGHGMHDEPPPPLPLQPGITTIFYSPFFPVLPPQPYSGGGGSYGGGAYGGGAPGGGPPGFGR